MPKMVVGCLNGNTLWSNSMSLGSAETLKKQLEDLGFDNVRIEDFKE